MRWLKKLLLVGFAHVAVVAALAQPLFAQNARITLLHVNDVYEIEANRGLGGVAGLMTLLKRERAAHPNSITAVAGDFISPSILSSALKGAQMIDLFNRIGVDFVTFGNHEFDFGPDMLKARIGQSKFVWLGTNVLGPDKRPFGGSVAVAFKTLGGVKLGFFGIVTRETVEVSNPGQSVTILPELEAAKGAVAELKAAGAQVVIGLTHLDVAQDRELARSVGGINVILGGHEHDPISYYEHGVLINKTGSDARFLGAVDLDVRTTTTANGPATSVQPQWRLIANSGIKPDPRIAKVVRGYEARLDQELGTEIGKTAVELDMRAAVLRSGEAVIGNVVADALKASLKAEIAMINGGSLRGGGVMPAGSTIAKKDVLNLLPFGSTAVLMEVKGAKLLAAIENGVSEVEDLAGRFPQVSGMKILYDPKAKAGQRVRSVEIGGKPLDPNATYVLATNDYMARGGDGYTALGDAKVMTDPRFTILIANTVMDYVQAQGGTIKPAIEGRIVAR